MVDASTGLAERLLGLLDQASVATTYKYALLLALIDASREATDASGDAPDSIEVRTLAEHVLGLYWPHTDPYPATGDVLRQSGTGQAEVVTRIREFRALDPGARSTLAAARYSPGFDLLINTTTWKLAEMPLPRLQRLGKTTDPFLYDIGWDERVTRRAFEGAAFDRAVHLRPGAGGELIRLAPLLRPLLEHLWSSRVIVYNRLPEGKLDDFLFRRTRLDAVRLRLALLEVQDGRCFYTGRPLQPANADVDHFLPWSRSPVNAVENLVIADRQINKSKSDFLASTEHVQHWRDRNRRCAADLEQIAHSNRWDSTPVEVLGVARAHYLPLGATARLWSAPDVVVPPDVGLLRSVLAN